MGKGDQEVAFSNFNSVGPGDLPFLHSHQVSPLSVLSDPCVGSPSFPTPYPRTPFLSLLVVAG